MSNPKLTLIGAGPGDPELITLKAVNALQQADVVLYDALSNPAILKHAPLHAEKIFVGKRKGCYILKQSEINELIVEKILTGNHVVRLKGGDPFVFGRGAEELIALQEHNIETEVIPGISSAFSVPASINIPLTSRGLSESFWVITGTTKERKLSKDIELACKSTATVVILMGMSKLPEIMEKFQENGKGETPVAVIQNGTCKNQRHVLGTVNNIAEKVEEQKLSNPAIILVGEVATVHHQVKSVQKQFAKQVVA